MEVEYCRSAYEKEWGRRKDVEGGLNVPIGILSLIATATAYLARSFRYEWDVQTLSFVAMLAGVASAFVLAVVYLMRVLHGFTYKAMPTPRELNEHEEQVLAYYKGGDRAKVAFEDYLKQRYAEATEVNFWNNVSKSEYLYRAHRAIVWLLILFAIMLVSAVISGILHANGGGETSCGFCAIMCQMPGGVCDVSR